MSVRSVSSFIPLILLSLIFTVARTVFGLHHLDTSEKVNLLLPLSTRLFVACWVYLDRRARRFNVPYEFDAFVFFAWPVVLPYYLYKSRGARGLLLTAFIYALAVAPDFAAVTLRVIYSS